VSVLITHRQQLDSSVTAQDIVVAVTEALSDLEEDAASMGVVLDWSNSHLELGEDVYEEFTYSGVRRYPFLNVKVVGEREEARDV
jgi:hypothetical protein